MQQFLTKEKMTLFDLIRLGYVLEPEINDKFIAKFVRTRRDEQDIESKEVTLLSFKEDEDSKCGYSCEFKRRYQTYITEANLLEKLVDKVIII